MHHDQGPPAWAAPGSASSSTSPPYHEPGDTPYQLDPARVQRMARFCPATAWLFACR